MAGFKETPPTEQVVTPDMSILNKLKNASGQKSNRLLENHPLVSESLELRLQYLAAIALATAIDREATLAERQAFNGLAASLAIETSDAEEQFNERASVEEDAIVVLFDALRARKAGQLYMLDLAWIHAVDGEVDENERQVTEHLAHLLGMPVQAVQELHEFAVALRRNELSSVYRLFPSILGDEKIKELLTPLIQKQMPFVGVLKGRWIDSGGQEITDCLTGLTWRRAVIGTDYTNGSFTGEPKQIINGLMFRNFENNKKEIKKILDEFNKKQSIIGRTWRLPNKKEAIHIIENNKLDTELFNVTNSAVAVIEKNNEIGDLEIGLNALGKTVEIIVCKDQ